MTEVKRPFLACFMESRPKTHLHFIHYSPAQMMRYRLLLCFCLLGPIVSCTSKTEKVKPVIQSITIMESGTVDSATATNPQHGIMAYVHFDFFNDSVHIFRKVFKDAEDYSIATRDEFNRFKKDTLIANLKAHALLNDFANQFSQFDFNNFYLQETSKKEKIKDAIRNDRLDEIRPLRRIDLQVFYVRLKTDSAEQVFAYNNMIGIPAFIHVTELFNRLTGPEKLRATTSKLNEDSLMAPFLARPALLNAFFPPPPLPDPPPPPPSKN
jgi:hypothetical protein